MGMTTTSTPSTNIGGNRQTNEERQAEAAAKYAALPIEGKAEVMGKEWGVSKFLALRILTLEAKVAELSAKS
jgi:hypothetical protein